jgi:hypothetical protein
MFIHRTTVASLILFASSAILTTTAFVVNPTTQAQTARCSSSTQLHGLFDGVKEAFKAPALERSTLNSERETPIDRWMGWSVASENEGVAASAQAG